MKGKIAFEEHFALPETLEDSRMFAGGSARWEDFHRQVLDIDEERLRLMEKNGIDYTILSLNAPAVQAVLDTQRAIEIARKANDRIAEAVRKHPKHFGGFAALPMQDPDAAARELTRCVRELGFHGALVNGFTQRDVPDSALYYDLPEYRDFWSVVQDLDVPLYLHPRTQVPANAKPYEGHPWLLSSPWGFAVETSIHALRLCGSGLFDRFPRLKLVIGHLGEHIPYDLWRIDARMRFSPRGYAGERMLGDYFKQHFHVTTSGNFCDPTFRCCLEVMGVDRMLFSADYPFETMEDAASWFDRTPLDEGDRLKIGRTNAIALFGLKLDGGGAG